jgi:hypothetical protein
MAVSSPTGLVAEHPGERCVSVPFPGQSAIAQIRLRFRLLFQVLDLSTICRPISACFA